MSDTRRTSRKNTNATVLLPALRELMGLTGFAGIAADEIERLEGQLRTVATHWPGAYTGYCMGCDDVVWPCDVVLGVVVPWMDDESDEPHP